jgi:hypothetical protein
LSGIAECRQALLLDPNLADAHGFIGLAKFLLGREEEVEGHIQEALRLSPRDTRAYLWYMFVGLVALFCNRRTQQIYGPLKRAGLGGIRLGAPPHTRIVDASAIERGVAAKAAK